VYPDKVGPTRTDGQLRTLHMDGEQVHARKEEMDLRHRMIEMTAGVLTRDQRVSLARLRPAATVME